LFLPSESFVRQYVIAMLNAREFTTRPWEQLSRSVYFIAACRKVNSHSLSVISSRAALNINHSKVKEQMRAAAACLTLSN
jgi:hypothetical protein